MKAKRLNRNYKLFAQGFAYVIEFDYDTELTKYMIAHDWFFDRYGRVVDFDLNNPGYGLCKFNHYWRTDANGPRARKIFVKDANDLVLYGLSI